MRHRDLFRVSKANHVATGWAVDRTNAAANRERPVPESLLFEFRGAEKGRKRSRFPDTSTPSRVYALQTPTLLGTNLIAIGGPMLDRRSADSRRATQAMVKRAFSAGKYLLISDTSRSASKYDLEIPYLAHNGNNQRGLQC
jgi:hypothetical protein